VYSADFHFTKQDAYANRFGKLTPQQEAVVMSIYQSRQRGAKQTVIPFIVFFFVLIILGVGVEFNQWEGTVSAFVQTTSPILLLVIVCFSAMLLVAGITTVLFSWDVRQRRISTVEGKASIYVGQAQSRGSVYMRYELTLKQGFFRSGFFRFNSETGVRQFEDGKQYRLYYIKFYPLPIVLSAEEVD
jgi:hypothetical protein